MEKRILLIGGAAKHLIRWFHYVTPILNENIVVDIFVTNGDKRDEVYEGAGNVYYSCKTPFLLKPLLHIPKIRALVMRRDRMCTFKEIMMSRKYYAINIHQVVPSTYQYAKYAKDRGIKIILTPWGSDVLRCPKKKIIKMKKIFALADYVTYNIERFSEKYIQIYNVEPSKMIFAGFGSEIFDLIAHSKGAFSKQKICNDLHIPIARYYITCGYMAGYAQRHKVMIKAIGENRSLIPDDTLLLFPFIYGDGKNETYMNELIQLCNDYDLKCFFVTQYLSNEDMAKFRLLPDLFIHIQPTDAACASLAEYLLAEVQVVNGKWLDYPHLEKDGMPYHVCESLESLPSLLKDFFTNRLPNLYISEKVRSKVMEGSWSNQKELWKSFFERI